MTYNVRYAPRGFFFINKMYNTGDRPIHYGFYNYETRRILYHEQAYMSTRPFNNFFEWVMRALGIMNEPDYSPYTDRTALWTALDLKDDFAAGNLNDSGKANYFAALCASRLVTPASCVPIAACTADHGQSQLFQFRINQNDPWMLQVARATGVWTSVTGDGMSDVQLAIALMNTLYPNLVYPTNGVISGAAFASVIPTEGGDGPRVPFVATTHREKEHSDGIAEEIETALIISATEWSHDESKWVFFNYGTTAATALGSLRLAGIDDPFAREIMNEDIAAGITSLMENIATVEGLANSLNNRWTDALKQDVATAVNQIDEQGLAITGLQNSVTESVIPKLEDIQEAVGHIDLDLTPITTLLEAVQARSAVDGQVMAMLLLKLAITKFRKKDRKGLFDLLSNLPYNLSWKPESVGETEGLLSLYQTLFDINGKLVASVEDSNGNDL